MNHKVFKIRTLTNMHVGGGDSSFGVVDKLVQRDPVTNFPTIHSSGLKGALREAFAGEDFSKYVFGSEPGAEKSEPGHFRFFSANLLALPVRSNQKPFFMATTPSILKDFKSTLESFGLKDAVSEDIKILSEMGTNENTALIQQNLPAKIEEWGTKQEDKVPATSALLGDNIAIFSETNFKELTKHLPVIARNHLNNGISSNLWYEEIVPRETLFYFVVGYGDDKQSEFEKTILNSNVQIGGNASIGYGVCEISKIGGDDEQKN